MPLFEYYCNDCKKVFEKIEGRSDPDRGICPVCSRNHTESLISKFAVGGRGDLRESTHHGCHGPFDPNFSGDSSHDGTKEH